MKPTALESLLLRKALLLTALEDHRGILGLEGWSELVRRVELARSMGSLDWVELNLMEIRFRDQTRKEGEAA